MKINLDLTNLAKRLLTLFFFSLVVLGTTITIAADEGTSPSHKPSTVFGDDRDKEHNPHFKTLGKHAMPIGRPRTEQEVLESIEYARETMLKEYPLQAELIKRLAAIELGAVYRKGNDKAPSLVLQGLPGMGKSTIFAQWLKLRDKAATYKSEVMNDKTVEFPVDSILRSAPKIESKREGENATEVTYYDGLDRIFNIDEVDKMKTLQELKERHEEVKRLGQNAIEMQIKGQAGNGLNGPGNWVTPDDLLRFENPITDYEERMRSLSRLWSILDSGFATPEPLHSAQTYIHLFNKLLDKVSAAQIQIDNLNAQIGKLRESSAGGKALNSAEVQVKQFEGARDLVVEEVYRLMRNMRLDYPPIFSKEELETPYQTLAESFVKDSAKAKEFIKRWDGKVPTSGRGQQYDMRGTLTVWSLNSPQLRELRELYEHRKVPATPKEAQEAVKALEQIFLDDFESIFHDRFTDREGGKRRFNFQGFQKLLMVPSEEEWRQTVATRLHQKADDLKALLKDKDPNLEITFDPSVHTGLYNLTVDGFEGWDDWRTKFDLYTKTFFSELMHSLKKDPKNKIEIAIDARTGSFIVLDKEAAVEEGKTPSPIFTYRPTEKSLEALHQPKKTQKLDPIRRSSVKAAKAVVATSLFGAVPRSTDPDFMELDHGYGIRGRYDVPTADLLEYELKVALAEIAGFVWQREGKHKFDVDHEVSVDYDRSFRVLEYLIRDPQLKKTTIEFLNGYAKRQGINFFLPESWKFNRLKPLEDVLPVHLRGTLLHKKLQADEDLSYILRAMYALDAYILRKNDKTLLDLARRQRHNIENGHEVEITEHEFKNVIRKTYRGGWGQQPLGRIVVAEPGQAHLQGCELLLAEISVRGKIARNWRNWVSTPGKVSWYKFSEWFKRVFRNN